MKVYRSWCINCGSEMLATKQPPGLDGYACTECDHVGPPFVSVEESGVGYVNVTFVGMAHSVKSCLGCGAYVDNTILHDAFHEELDLAVERARQMMDSSARPPIGGNPSA